MKKKIASLALSVVFIFCSFLTAVFPACAESGGVSFTERVNAVLDELGSGHISGRDAAGYITKLCDKELETYASTVSSKTRYNEYVFSIYNSLFASARELFGAGKTDFGNYTEFYNAIYDDRLIRLRVMRDDGYISVDEYWLKLGVLLLDAITETKTGYEAGIYSDEPFMRLYSGLQVRMVEMSYISYINGRIELADFEDILRSAINSLRSYAMDLYKKRRFDGAKMIELFDRAASDIAGEAVRLSRTGAMPDGIPTAMRSALMSGYTEFIRDLREAELIDEAKAEEKISDYDETVAELKENEVPQAAGTLPAETAAPVTAAPETTTTVVTTTKAETTTPQTTTKAATATTTAETTTTAATTTKAVTTTTKAVTTTTTTTTTTTAPVTTAETTTSAAATTAATTVKTSATTAVTSVTVPVTFEGDRDSDTTVSAAETEPRTVKRDKNPPTGAGAGMLVPAAFSLAAAVLSKPGKRKK